MTTDAGTLALEQAYGQFPEGRLRRVGVSPTDMETLRATWSNQPLGWRYEQGLAIAAAPDDWVAAQVGQWPPPLEIPLAVYVGDEAPADPPADALWWSKITESTYRWDATLADWVADSGSAAGLFVPNSLLAAAGGVATLGTDGKLVSAQVPAFVLGQTFIAASEAAMLALDANIGDLAKRTDLTGAPTFLLTESDASVLANWLQILSSTGEVTSVNGQAGVVTLGPADVGTDAAGTPRPPTTHKSSHATGGSDALTPADIGAAAATDSRFTDQRVPTDGSVTDAKVADGISGGKVAVTTSGLIVVTHNRVQAALADLDAAVAALEAVGGVPSGAAGGSLAGTYPSPSIAAGVVGHTQINRTTDPLQETDVALASDALPSTPSRRSTPYRCQVGSWRGDPGAVAAVPFPLTFGYVNQVLWSPLWVPSQETWDELGFFVAAGGAGAGAVFRLGLYADTGDGKPSSLIYDGGQKTLSATGTTAWVIATDHATVWQTVAGFTSAAAVGQVGAGLYWAALVLQSTPTTYPTMQVTSTLSPFVGGAGAPLPSAGWAQTGVSGALPTTAAPTGSAPASRYLLGARIASRP